MKLNDDIFSGQFFFISIWSSLCQGFNNSTFNHFSGTLTTIVALQVINKTSEDYWFVYKIISITAAGENLEKIGNVTRGRSLYFLVRVERSSR